MVMNLGFCNRQWIYWPDKRLSFRWSSLFRLCSVRVTVTVTDMVTRSVQPYKVQLCTPGPTYMTCGSHSHICATREQSAQALASFSTPYIHNSHYKLLNQTFWEIFGCAKGNRLTIGPPSLSCRAGKFDITLSAWGQHDLRMTLWNE